MHEKPKRSWLKAISWRMIATSTGMFLVYFFTGPLELTVGFGIGDVVLKLIFYFMHERVWNMTEYGRSFGGKVTSSMRSPRHVPTLRHSFKHRSEDGRHR